MSYRVVQHVLNHQFAWQHPHPTPKRRICCGAFCPRGIATVTQHSHQTPQHLRFRVVGWGWLGIRYYLYHWSSREKWGKNGVTRLGFRWFKPPVGKKNKNTSTKLAWAFKLRLWPTHYPGAPETKLPGWSAVETEWNTWRYLEISGDVKHRKHTAAYVLETSWNVMISAFSIF